SPLPRAAQDRIAHGALPNPVRDPRQKPLGVENVQQRPQAPGLAGGRSLER
ncbi:MAG: hypothetical protein Q9196_004181, partial [Gyalolechia fulgens]